MRKFLATPSEIAYFDFLTQIVTLAKFEGRDLASFQTAIAWEPGKAIDSRTSYLRSLLIHEITHFLDTTTTAWGAQYTYRKLRMLRKVQGDHSPQFRNADQVFALETGELEMHSALVKTGNVPPATCDVINHGLIHQPKYGICIVIHYLKDGVRHHSVPVTMLSLLEANATASEFLSLIQCAESYEEKVERDMAMSEVQRSFTSLLNDPALMEYSSLLHLTKIHFIDLSLREQLRLVSALARFSLDASMFALIRMANTIQDSFLNKDLGDQISMELRRDSCRQLIFLKTVLFMYEWLQAASAEKRTVMMHLLREDPVAAIEKLWAEKFNEDEYQDKIFRDMVFKNHLDMISDLKATLADERIFHESSIANRQLLEASPAGILNFSELKLLNAVMGDDTELVFPNSIDLSIPAYVDENIDSLTKLAAGYRAMKHERFHLAPDSELIIRST